MEKPVWGAKALAEALGCSPRQVFYFHEKKLLPIAKIGGKLVGYPDVIAKAIAEKAAAGADSE